MAVDRRCCGCRSVRGDTYIALLGGGGWTWSHCCFWWAYGKEEMTCCLTHCTQDELFQNIFGGHVEDT